MKACVDKDVCIDCRLCTDQCPEVFGLENDRAFVKVQVFPQD
jgi:ferredoxin